MVKDPVGFIAVAASIASGLALAAAIAWGLVQGTWPPSL